MFLPPSLRNLGWNRLAAGKGSLERGLEGVGGNEGRKKDRTRGHISVKSRVVSSLSLAGVVLVKNLCHH